MMRAIKANINPDNSTKKQIGSKSDVFRPDALIICTPPLLKPQPKYARVYPTSIELAR
jgi:hypothetical protein